MTAKKLTPKQQRFVDEYLIDLNATQAAIRAGYSKKTAASIGDENLRKPAIAAVIDERRKGLSEKAEVDAADVLRQVARMAMFDPRKLFDSDGNPLPIHELPDEVAFVIQGLKVRKEITGKGDDMEVAQIIEYKMADRNSAAEKLMKHLGLYEKDNNQKTDPIADLLAQFAGSAGVLDQARKRTGG